MYSYSPSDESQFVPRQSVVNTSNISEHHVAASRQTMQEIQGEISLKTGTNKSKACKGTVQEGITICPTPDASPRSSFTLEGSVASDANAVPNSTCDSIDYAVDRLAESDLEYYLMGYIPDESIEVEDLSLSQKCNSVVEESSGVDTSDKTAVVNNERRNGHTFAGVAAQSPNSNLTPNDYLPVINIPQVPNKDIIPASTIAGSDVISGGVVGVNIPVSEEEGTLKSLSLSLSLLTCSSETKCPVNDISGRKDHSYSSKQTPQSAADVGPNNQDAVQVIQKTSFTCHQSKSKRALFSMAESTASFIVSSMILSGSFLYSHSPLFQAPWRTKARCCLKGSFFALLISTVLLCSKSNGIKTTKRINIDDLDTLTGNHSANDLRCFSTHAFTFMTIPMVEFYLSEALFEAEALSEDELATDDKHSSDSVGTTLKDVSKHEDGFNKSEPTSWLTAFATMLMFTMLALFYKSVFLKWKRLHEKVVAFEEINNELKSSVRGYAQEIVDPKDERDHLEKKSVQLGKENDLFNSTFGCYNGKDAKLDKRNQLQENHRLKEAEEESFQLAGMCGQLGEEDIHHNFMASHEQIDAGSGRVVAQVQEPTQCSRKEDATNVEQESSREVKDTHHDTPPDQLGHENNQIDEDHLQGEESSTALANEGFRGLEEVKREEQESGQLSGPKAVPKADTKKSTTKETTEKSVPREKSANAAPKANVKTSTPKETAEKSGLKDELARVVPAAKNKKPAPTKTVEISGSNDKLTKAPPKPDTKKSEPKLTKAAPKPDTKKSEPKKTFKKPGPKVKLERAIPKANTKKSAPKEAAEKFGSKQKLTKAVPDATTKKPAPMATAEILGPAAGLIGGVVFLAGLVAMQNNSPCRNRDRRNH